MSDYRRPRQTGATIFFSVALASRGSDLLVSQVDLLRAAVLRTRDERPFLIDAFVVLPDHLHAVWTLPPGDADFSGRWAAIKARFTRAVKSPGRVGLNPTTSRSASKVAKGDAGLWQRRFWDHHIRDQTDYDAHVRYCWGNPVKHGLVGTAADWPFSSIHRDIKRGLVGAEWSGTPGEGRFGE